jgi:FkbM family methyltransferase
MGRLTNALYRRARWLALGDRMVNLRGTGVVGLIDVGSVGSLPSPWNEHARRIAHLLKFEPRDRAGSSNPHVATCNTALWDAECERSFFIYQGQRGTGSSLFEQNVEYVRENFDELRSRGPRRLAETWFERSRLVRVEKVRCRRLDDVLAEHELPYEFLKIDAQGAEYEILRGAEGFLRDSCIGLHLELFALPLYKGIKLLPEVEHHLAGLGFELAKKYPAHGSFDSQHDCVFLKSGASGAVFDAIREVYGLTGR